MGILRGSTFAWWREVGAREGFHILYWWPFTEWLSRPAWCKLGRHTFRERGEWNGDAMAYEYRYLECSRCELWAGYTEYCGRPVPGPHPKIAEPRTKFIR